MLRSSSFSILPIFSLTGAVFIAVLSGCVSPPKSRLKHVEGPAAPEKWAAEASAGVFDATRWTSDFRDPQLQTLVSRALGQNFSLKAAWNRLEAAEQTARIEGAAVWPSLSLGQGGSRAQRNSSDGINRIAAINDTFNLTARASWEVDLWGRLRNAARAGLADFQAAREDYRAAQLSLAARVAGAWYDAIEAERQLELARDSLTSFENNLAVVEESFRRGIARSLDVHLIRANVASARSSLEQRLRFRDASARFLEILLGGYPDATLSLKGEIPDELPSAQAGVPGDIVLRRPDLIAAERRLAATNERAAEAFKNRLPGLTLSATGGTSTGEFGPSFDIAKNQVWSLAYNLSQTLFQGGRLRAADLRARALYEGAANGFVASLLGAWREVENTLEAEASLARDVEAQRLATEESIAAEEVAWDQYQRGLADIITAIEAQRRSIVAQRSFIQVKNQRVQNRIDLYLALGGGLETPPSAGTVPLASGPSPLPKPAPASAPNPPASK